MNTGFPKFGLWLLYCSGPLLLLLLLVLVPSVIYFYVTLIGLYCCHPLLDKIELRPPEKSIVNLVSLLWVCILGFSLLFLMIGISKDQYDTVEIIFFILAQGIVIGTFGFTVAHELIHRAEKHWQWAGVVLLLLFSMPFFHLTHIKVHHVWLATPRDPSSAKQGESVYKFIFRSFFGNLKLGWRIDAFRCFTNFLTWAVLLVTICFSFGGVAVLFFLGQSVVGIILLEITQYVQHYGLKRDLTPDGQYQAITKHHAWQTSFTSTNFYFMNLGFHPDHHKSFKTEYSELVRLEGCYEHPFGLGKMLVLTLVPRLWRKNVDPLLEKK